MQSTSIKELSKPKLLQKDLALLHQLRANARTSLTEMSKKTRIPISTLYDRLRVNEGSLIRKHTSLLDFEKLGYQARVHVLLKAPSAKRQSLENHLNFHESVNSLFRLANGFHFLVECIFSTISEKSSSPNKLTPFLLSILMPC